MLTARARHLKVATGSANQLFPGHGEDTVAMFAEQVYAVWVGFDVFHQLAIKEYLEHGGIKELCVMQFTQHLDKFEKDGQLSRVSRASATQLSASLSLKDTEGNSSASDS